MSDMNDAYKNRWASLAVLSFLPFMATLGATVVNVALPVMAKQFSMDISTIQMVVLSYLLGVVCSLLLFGRLGDIVGKTSVFNFGLLVFTLGSLFCGLSNNFHILIFSRVIQAIGASAAMANNQGIITQIFPINERGKALGISGTMLALGTMAGPPIGGFIATYFKWNYIFYINVPIGVVTTIIGFLILPRDSMKKGKIDVVGTVLLSFSILCLFYAFTISTNANRNNLLFFILLITAIFLFCYFLFIEKKAIEPTIDLTIFKNMVFSVSLFCTFISNMVIGGYSLILPFYLEDVLKLSPSDAGLIMMIFAIILAVVSPFSGALADKIGSEMLTLAGLVTMAMGLVLMATLNQIVSYITLSIFICVIGLGYGLFQPPNNTLVMSNAPKNKLGIAGSLNAFARNIGTTFGISLSTMILYTFMSLKAGKSVSGYIQGRGDIFVYGMRYAFIFMGAICLAGSVLIFIKLINKNTNKQIQVW